MAEKICPFLRMTCIHDDCKAWVPEKKVDPESEAYRALVAHISFEQTIPKELSEDLVQKLSMGHCQILDK